MVIFLPRNFFCARVYKVPTSKTNLRFLADSCLPPLSLGGFLSPTYTSWRSCPQVVRVILSWRGLDSRAALGALRDYYWPPALVIEPWCGGVDGIRGCYVRRTVNCPPTSAIYEDGVDC